MSSPSDGTPSPGGRSFLDVSRRFLDLLGADGLGSEWEQQDYGVAGIEPRWVLLPATVDECAEVLRLCAAQRLAVVPAGFGRRLRQGRAPGRFDVILCTSRMSRIVEHAAADMTVVVEAGASLAGVNRTLVEAGQWLPFDPPFPGETSIGGLLAANVSGPSRQAFGTARESLIGLRAVLADGSIVTSGGRVVKNVAGYDLHRLLVGSFGTLAVIVEANFKCRPLAEKTEIVELDGDRRVLLDAARKIAASPLQPIFLELLFAADRPARLLIGFSGIAEQVDWAMERTAAIAPAGARVSGSGDPEGLRAEIEAIADTGGDALVIRCGVRPRDLGDWLDEALSAGSGFRGHAHAGIGVARLRIESIEAPGSGDLVARLRRSALERGGYVVVESAFQGTTEDAWGILPSAAQLMSGVKQAFDPTAMLSPGRFVGGI